MARYLIMLFLVLGANAASGTKVECVEWAVDNPNCGGQLILTECTDRTLKISMTEFFCPEILVLDLGLIHSFTASSQNPSTTLYNTINKLGPTNHECLLDVIVIGNEVKDEHEIKLNNCPN